MNLNKQNINIDLSQLKRIYGDKNISATYCMQFYCNYPESEIISFTYVGQVDTMPLTINDIISSSKFFRYMMDIFESYHMNLELEEYDVRASPLQIKTRVRARGEPFVMEYSYILDFKKEYLHNESCVV